MKKENKIVLTGIRPTSNMTIANYVGAIKPILDFQEQGLKPFVFVADLHALTDNDPEILRYGDEILIDLLATGIDPEKSVIYKQTDIKNEISMLTLLLARNISVSELIRLPTLKEKVKSGESENANTLLLMYPVMMAADILVQRSNIIPVGKDQKSHIEIASKIAKRFNKEIGQIFPIPETHVMEMVKILSLRGTSKMSKSLPDDAIFLTDDPKIIKRKINRAETANTGDMSESLKSHITLIRSICNDSLVLNELDIIVGKHLRGEMVMKDFKMIFFSAVNTFVSNFQDKRKRILENKDHHLGLLKSSSNNAILRAQETMIQIYNKIGV